MYLGLMLKGREVAQQGGIAVNGNRFGLIELVTFPDGGSGPELHQLDFPYLGVETRTTSELEMVGVLRRQHVLRKLVECGPEDIKKGDKLVLESETGEQITTTKTKAIVS